MPGVIESAAGDEKAGKSGRGDSDHTDDIDSDGGGMAAPAAARVSSTLAVPLVPSLEQAPAWAWQPAATSNSTNSLVRAIGNGILKVKNRVTGLERAQNEVFADLQAPCARVTYLEARSAAIAAPTDAWASAAAALGRP